MTTTAPLYIFQKYNKISKIIPEVGLILKPIKK
jgi:hypothetical protein